VAIRVLIADGHDIVRSGLVALLGGQPDIEVVASFGSGPEILSQLKALSSNVDVAVLDISMPGIGGIEVAAEIRRRGLSCQSIIISARKSEIYVWRSLTAGARGFLSKESLVPDLPAAIRAVRSGHYYFSANILNVVVEGYLRDSSLNGGDPFARLSIRERQIVLLVMDGKSSSEIAQTLSLSTRTVQEYRSRIMRKLGVEDLPTLVKLVMAYGLA
jgi:DNA-binding NarL/FixJ family response regulator